MRAEQQFMSSSCRWESQPVEERTASMGNGDRKRDEITFSKSRKSFATQLRVQPKSPKSQSDSNRIITLCFPSLPSSIYTLESTMVGKPPAVQSEVHCRGQVVRWILRLRQPSLLFYTVSNQAVLKGNFWISLFVQCSWMRHLVHVLSNLKADLSHRSWSREWVTGRNSGWSCVLLRLS